MNPTPPTITQEKYPKKNVILISAFSLIIIVALCVGLFLKYSKPATTPQASTDKTVIVSQAKTQYDEGTSLLNKGDTKGAIAAYKKSQDLYRQSGRVSEAATVAATLDMLTRTPYKAQAKPTAIAPPAQKKE